MPNTTSVEQILAEQHIARGEEGDSFEAERSGKTWGAQYGALMTTAHVDRDEGLVIFAPGSYGFHFRTALCGYEGSGPMAAASILASFGFGEEDQILNQIKHGYHHSFSKG